MDLETNRIKTKLTLPFIPVKNMKTNVVVLPSTAEGDGRLVATGPGWLLSELGVSEQVLATTPNAASALRTVDEGLYNIPSTIFAEAEALHGRQRLKAMFQNMVEALDTHSRLLNKMFTDRTVRRVREAIEDVLDEYAEVEEQENRPARRMAFGGRR